VSTPACATERRAAVTALTICPAFADQHCDLRSDMPGPAPEGSVTATSARSARPNTRSRNCGTPWSTSASPGLTILTAWIPKEELRRLLALAGTAADPSVISHLERLAGTRNLW